MVLKREGLHPSASICARVCQPLHHKAAGAETSCCWDAWMRQLHMQRVRHRPAGGRQSDQSGGHIRVLLQALPSIHVFVSILRLRLSGGGAVISHSAF